MLILLYGGASCGKEALARSLCTGLGGRSLYLSTRSLRQEGSARSSLALEDGFDVMEYYDDLRRMGLPPEKGYDNLLMEDLGDWVAVSLYRLTMSPRQVYRKAMEGIHHLEGQVDRLVMVTEDVFSGGEALEQEEALWLECMAAINRRLAQEAALFIEVVCGLPIYHKGQGALPV